MTQTMKTSPHRSVLFLAAITSWIACSSAESTSAPDQDASLTDTISARADAGTVPVDAGPVDAGLVDARPVSDSDSSGQTQQDVADAAPQCHDCPYVPIATWTNIKVIEGFTIASSAGGRELPVLVRYPADATSPLPVVLWAHGGAFNPTGHKLNLKWSTTLAKAGYAVIHWATIRPTIDELKALCMSLGVTDPALCDDSAVTGDPSAPPPDDAIKPFNSLTIVRAADPASILNSLPKIAEKLAEKGIELKVDRPVVAGWSGGSQCPMQLAGATRLVGPTFPPYSQPSAIPAAFIALSPQGPGYSSFFDEDDENSWSAVRGPILVATGDGDEKPDNDMTGAIRRKSFDLMPPGDKILFYSKAPHGDVVHSTFNLEGGGAESAVVSNLSTALISTVLAFLDANVHQHPAALAWLKSDNANGIVAGLLSWESK
ncbi:MAG: hypothetical protein ACI9OJ_002122 [Myxococcota bacterium]|jgi:hypothetical protein